MYTAEKLLQDRKTEVIQHKKMRGMLIVFQCMLPLSAFGLDSWV